MKNLIFLYGAPASGKTTLGQKLGAALGATFVDLDAEIVAREGRPIPAIFATDGEPVFRDIEARTLAAIVDAATGTTVTMLVASFFLAPTVGAKIIFANYNFIYHVAAPLLGLIRALFFEDAKEKARFYFAFFGVVHMGIYGIFYLANVVIHNGYGTTKYDWYGFGKGGLGLGILSFFLIFALAFGICFGLLCVQNVFAKRNATKE